MSRAAVSKSRADKGKPGPASQTPVVSHDIVSGKFTDHDWNTMVERDGAEDFVEDIIEDILDTAMGKIYDLYIQKQLLPFTITLAKDAILQIIEWQFLARDEGEHNTESDSAWLEDEEPDPAVTDCWAQGSVPKSFIRPPTPEPIEEEDEEEVARLEEELGEEKIEEEPELEDRVSETEEEPENPEDDKALIVLEEAKKAIEKLQKNDIIEIKSFSSPPQMVKIVMDAILILLGSEPSWKEARRQMANPLAFLKRLLAFDKDNISERRLKQISQICANPDFQPEAMKKVSAATESLCQWVKAMEIYGHLHPGGRKQTHPPGQISDKQETTKKPEEDEEVKKRKIQFKPYRGAMMSAGLARMTESLDQTEMAIFAAELQAEFDEQDMPSGLLNMPASCHSILKAQAGRPPGNKDVTFDELGNVVAVIKLNPERLPSHRVKVSYQVVDPSVEAAQARLEAMRTGKFLKPELKVKRRTGTMEEVQASTDKSLSKPKVEKTALPPPLIESMEIAAGVTVREGGRMKRGPARYVRRGDMLTESQGGLRPVTQRNTAPPMDVSDLLDRTTPVLRPIRDSPPLPPIMPHPPSQPRITT